MWKVFSEVTPIFAALTESPSTFNEEHMSVLESFAVGMYDRSSTETSVDALENKYSRPKADLLIIFHQLVHHCFNT